MLSDSGNSLAALFRQLTQYTQRCLYNQPGLPPANKKRTKPNRVLTYYCNLRMLLTKKPRLKKQLTFRDVTGGLPAKWRPRNERRNSTLMTRRYPDLGSDASLVWNFRDRFSDINSQGNQRLIPSWKEKIERRLGLHKDAFLPMSLRAPQPKPNLLSPQKHIKATGYESGETNHRWRRKMSAV